MPGRNNGNGRGDQADTSGVAQAARGVPHHAAGRRAGRAETVAEKRLLAVAVVAFAEPEPAVVVVVVAAHVVPAGRLPRADRHQEQRADAVARDGGGGPGQEAQHQRQRVVVSVGRAQRRTVPEPVQVVGRRHQETAAGRLGSARQRRCVQDIRKHFERRYIYVEQ